MGPSRATDVATAVTYVWLGQGLLSVGVAVAQRPHRLLEARPDAPPRVRYPALSDPRVICTASTTMAVPNAT